MGSDDAFERTELFEEIVCEGGDLAVAGFVQSLDANDVFRLLRMKLGHDVFQMVLRETGTHEQDAIIRILRERWPRLPTGELVLPDGRADSERIYLWYGGAEDGAVVTLRPIELRDFSL